MSVVDMEGVKRKLLNTTAGSTHSGWRFQTETNNSLHFYG